MLFLLNATVVRTSLTLELPRGLESLAHATPKAVLKAGAELYAKHPKLEVERPDIARWYCTLLQHRFPDAGGVHFRETPKGYVPRLADVPLPLLVQLWSLQAGGVDIAKDVRTKIWEPIEQAA